MSVHPTAIIEIGEPLPDDVQIGPFAVLRGVIALGPGCRIGAHAQLLGRVTLGKGCAVGGGAILGGDPQDLSFDPATDSGILAGEGNVFREHVTVHRSTMPGGLTRIGDGNFFMVGAHVGHDCVVGDRNVFANNCLLGGHVSVGNRAFLGGGSAYHQHVRVGDLAMTQGNTAMSMDTPPYVIARRVNEIVGLNRVGLERAGFAPDVRDEIREAFNLCYRQGLNLSQTLAAAEGRDWRSAEARAFFDFLRAGSRKGVPTRLSSLR